MPTEVNKNSGVIGTESKQETASVVVETVAQKQENPQGHTSQQQTQMWENVESKYAGFQRDYKNWVPNKNETGDSDKLFFLSHKAITFRLITRILGTVPNRDQAAEIARYYLNLVDMSKISTYFSQEIRFSPDSWLSLVKQGRGLDDSGQPLPFVSKYAKQLFNAAKAVLSNPKANQDHWRYALGVLELLTKCDNPQKELAHLVLARSIFHDKADDFLNKKMNILPSAGVDRQTTGKPVFEINEKRYEYACKHIKELPLWCCDDESIFSDFVKEMPLADVVMISDMITGHLHLENQKGSRQYDLNKFLRIYFKIVDIEVLKADRAANQIVKIIAKIGCGNFYEVLDQIGAIKKKTSFIDLLRNETTANNNTYKKHRELSEWIDNFNEKKSLLGLNLLCNEKYLRNLTEDRIKKILSWLDFKHIESFFKFVMDIRDQDLRSRIFGLILSTNSLVAKLSAEQKDQLIDQLILPKKNVESLTLPDPYSNAKFRLRMFAETKDEKDIKRFEEILEILSSALNDLKELNEKDESYSKKAEYYSLKLALEKLPEGIKNPKSKSVMSLLVLQRSEIHEHLLDRASLSKLVNNLQAKELEQFKKPEQNLAKIILKNDGLREKYELVHKSENKDHDALIDLFNVAWTPNDFIKEVIEFICNNTLSETCANAFVEWILQQQDAFKEQILQRYDEYDVWFNRIIRQLNDSVLLKLIINVAEIKDNEQQSQNLIKYLISDIDVRTSPLKTLLNIHESVRNAALRNPTKNLIMIVEKYIWDNYSFHDLSQGLLSNDSDLQRLIADFACIDTNIGNINKRINFIGSIIIKPKEERNKIPNDDMKKLTNFYDKHKDRIGILLKLKLIIMNLGKLIRKMFGIKDQPVVTGVMSTKSTPVAHVDERAIPRQEGGSYQQTCQEMPDQHVEEVKAVKEALKEIGEYLKHLENRSKSTWKKKSTTFDAKSKIYQNLQQSFLDSTFANIDELKQTVEDQIKQMDKETGKESKYFRRLVDKLFDALKKFSEVSSQKDCRSLRSEISNLTTQRIIPYNELLNAIQRSCKQFNSEHSFQGGVPDGVKEIQGCFDADMVDYMKIVMIQRVITRKTKASKKYDSKRSVERAKNESEKVLDPFRIFDTLKFYEALGKRIDHVLQGVKALDQAFEDVLNPKESIANNVVVHAAAVARAS